MRIHEFAHRLDELFDLRQHSEPDGWDFAMTREGKSALMGMATPIFRETFNGLVHLGLSLESDVNRIYLIVFPERTLIDQIIELEQTRGIGGAVIVTHHPVDMETSDRGFIEIPEIQLTALAAAGVAIYVLHAPLDCNERISTSSSLATGLKLKRDCTFAPYHGGKCGVIGTQEPEPFGAFAARVRELCEFPGFNLDQVRFAGRDVSRVAIVAGGGDDVDYIQEAESLGCDTYLAGHWWTPHRGEWCDQNRSLLRDVISKSKMNFLSASHDGSELVVFRDQLLPLFESWKLDVQLLRQADHWR